MTTTQKLLPADARHVSRILTKAGVARRIEGTRRLREQPGYKATNDYMSPCWVSVDSYWDNKDRVEQTALIIEVLTAAGLVAEAGQYWQVKVYRPVRDTEEDQAHYERAVKLGWKVLP
jgi:hypothetical protein